ncbi:MAG: hypothetical protein ACOYCB_01655 [Fastidiosipilaceae bacterium]|jgi:hypothetical protein|nr:hypothetical protein [Clostridiaceae bacterium]
MNLENKVDRWVLHELVNFYFTLNAQNMDIKLETDHMGNLTIHASGQIPQIDDVDLKALQKSLDNGRAAEVELYYGYLALVQQDEVNLELLGDLIDWGKASIEGDMLYVSVFREV